MSMALVLARRCSALGLLFFFIGLAWALAGQPLIIKLEDYDLALAETQERLGRTQGIAAQRESLAARRDRLTQHLSAESGFLEGTNAELAAADIQNEVKRVVTANGGTLKSTQALRADDKEGFPKVAVRVAMTADTAALQRTFHALETATPYLLLDNVDIRSAAVQSRLKRTKGTSNFQVRFDVYGFMKRARQ